MLQGLFCHLNNYSVWWLRLDWIIAEFIANQPDGLLQTGPFLLKYHFWNPQHLKQHSHDVKTQTQNQRIALKGSLVRLKCVILINVTTGSHRSWLVNTCHLLGETRDVTQALGAVIYWPHILNSSLLWSEERRSQEIRLHHFSLVTPTLTFTAHPEQACMHMLWDVPIFNWIVGFYFQLVMMD